MWYFELCFNNIIDSSPSYLVYIIGCRCIKNSSVHILEQGGIEILAQDKKSERSEIILEYRYSQIYVRIYLDHLCLGFEATRLELLL
jgi:hypothetical protein